MKYRVGAKVKCTGRKRLIIITGIVEEILMHGYKVREANGLVAYVRHEHFEIEEAEE